MEIIALFVLYVGAFSTGILIMLFLYFIFCLAKEVVRYIKIIIKQKKKIKQNKKQKETIRNIIAIGFRDEMRELREPQIYKEVLNDEN